MNKLPYLLSDISILQYDKMKDALLCNDLEHYERFYEACACVTDFTPSVFCFEEGDDRDIRFITELTEEKDISVVRIVTHVQKLVETYEYENEPPYIHIDGESYFLQAEPSAGSVLTQLEYQRLIQDRVKQDSLSEEDGKLSTMLHICALLFMKEGEILPFSKTERDKFIEQRQILFQQASLKSILDVSFFLSRTLVQSKKEEITNFILTVCRQVHTVTLQQLKRSKQKQEPRASLKKRVIGSHFSKRQKRK